jgi:uncharacterized repeat protein (TIGR03803 family)
VGTVFEINLAAQTYTILYSFGSQVGDGTYPFSGVTFDTKGNLYGTTSEGGNYSVGTLYSLSPSGNETILHSFGATGDGYYPGGAVLLYAKGSLYGTTPPGGADNLGAIYKVTP